MNHSENIKAKARELGFELAGIASAVPTLESMFYPQWLEQGFHGQMGYLEGKRGQMRADPSTLLPSVESVICVGMFYNTPTPYSTQVDSDETGWISRYAWGNDYHSVLEQRLNVLADWVRDEYGQHVDCKVCVDTSPLLERAYAYHAGLGWIGKNCCLINEQLGSWFFLGEILTSLKLAVDEEAPFRCGTCRRCIDACPTDAFIELGTSAGPSHALDSRLCISYWTIELKGPIPQEHRTDIGHHLFGCDICQDVCPWNSPQRAAETKEPAFQPENGQPDLLELAALTEEEFNSRFADTPIERSRYEGFLRNVVTALGNSGNTAFREPLERLSNAESAIVREHARWALSQLECSQENTASIEPQA